MSQLSDDESSDSSNEFLVPADKIDLDSSFFKQPVKKPNPKKTPVVRRQISSDDSDDDLEHDNDASSSELLAQVLKNLENAKNPFSKVETIQPQASTSTAPNTGLEDSKNDLSKEISDLLLQGESETTLAKEDNYEDANKDSKEEAKVKYDIPQEGVQIHLPGSNILYDRKKKKQQDLQKLLQNKINQRIRSSQLFTHKVGLLCWLAHGFHLNKIANDPDLLAVALSLVSPNNYPNGRTDLKYLERFTKWFSSLFKICEEHKEVVYNKDLLTERLQNRKIYNYVELILLYIATLRGMGFNCRLVISLQPPPLKPKPDQLFKVPKPEENSDLKQIKEEVDEKVKKEKNSAKKSKGKVVSSRGKTGKAKTKSEDQSDSPSKVVPGNSREAQKLTNMEAKKKAAAILKGKLISDSKLDKSGTKMDKNDQEKDIQKMNSNNSKKDVNIVDGSNTSIARKLRTRIQNSQSEKTKAEHSKNTKGSKTKSKNDMPPAEIKHSSSSENFSEDEESDFSTDDEYIDIKPKKRTIKKSNQRGSNSSKLTKSTNKERKLLSSDEEDQNVIKNAYNVWVEVFVESEESWISVSVLDHKIHCVSEIYKKAGNPVLYIIAWNSAGTLKDVTRRYCPHWLTNTRKKRVDEKWWDNTLCCWKEKKSAMSKAEDEQLLQKELEQPLPKTVTECKGHPLYALTRHLLKFEALYPPDAAPLGHLKTGEAIYSRHCVHTLYSRETWVKKARVVKPAQEAYKIVKSMPKYDKLSGMKIKDQPLELFGKWQTGPYVPPEAKDGKVPRNEYGNVDLFKMCMLPIGTAYVNLPGLSRVARKLNIDCAPACVGFNFGCRGALPAFEGFVVCKEYEDTIREAWEEEQIEAQKRMKEKREKRIYGNWKKLIRGLLIRRKLAAKYNFGEENSNDEELDNEDEKIVPVEKVATKVFKKITIPAAKKIAATKRPKRDPVTKYNHGEESNDDEEVDYEDEKIVPVEKVTTKVFKKITVTAAKKITATKRPKRELVTKYNHRDESSDDEEVDNEDEEIVPVEKVAKKVFKKITVPAAKKIAATKRPKRGPVKKYNFGEESSNDEEVDNDDEEIVPVEKVGTKKITVTAAKKTTAIKRPKREPVTKYNSGEESSKDEEVDNEDEEIVPVKKVATKKITVTAAKKTTATKRTKKEPVNTRKRMKNK